MQQEGRTYPKHVESEYQQTTSVGTSAMNTHPTYLMFSSERRLKPNVELHARAAISRLGRLVSKEEKEFRGDISTAERIDFNHLYKGFFQDLMILRYYAVEASSSPQPTRSSVPPKKVSVSKVRLVPIAASGTRNAKSSNPGRTGSLRRGGTRSVVFGAETSESRLKKASTVYECSAMRTDNVRALQRSHYHHPIPIDHILAMEYKQNHGVEYQQHYSVLPPGGSRSLALKSLLVEEVQLRESIRAEEKDWRRWRSDQETILRAKAKKEGKLMALVHEVEFACGVAPAGSSGMTSAELHLSRIHLRELDRVEREEGSSRATIIAEELKECRNNATAFQRQVLSHHQRRQQVKEKEISCMAVQCLARTTLARAEVHHRRRSLDDVELIQSKSRLILREV